MVSSGTTLNPDMRSQCAITVSWLLAILLVGLCSADAGKSGLLGKLSLPSTRIQQCREGCLEKFAIKEEICQQRPECSMCWDECAKPPPPKINKSILETWALRTVSMLQQDSLVLVDVAWSPLNTPNQCLVTWEVSGGGLMGNLLTESSNVQLSLWPDTKYRVQVTCKNKKTGAMSRSLPLTIDTVEAVPSKDRVQDVSTVPSAPVLSSSAPIPPSHKSISTDSQPLPSSTFTSSDDHSNDLFNHHTNFVFNWHNTDDSDVTIDKIEPLDHPDLNIMTIAALSDMQKPLLFGVIAGTILLAVILLMYICFCMLRGDHISSDKRALIDDDGNSTMGISTHLGVGPSVGVCNPATAAAISTPIDPAAVYARTVHVLTV